MMERLLNIILWSLPVQTYRQFVKRDWLLNPFFCILYLLINTEKIICHSNYDVNTQFESLGIKIYRF